MKVRFNKDDLKMFPGKEYAREEIDEIWQNGNIRF